MKSKRRWGEFPKRFKRELEGTAAIVAVGGIGLGAAGWGFFAPVLTPLVIGAGGFLAAGALGYSAYNAIPPKMVRPSTLVGKVLELGALEAFSERIPRVAIVGPSQAGKTTLRKRLNFNAEKSERTLDVSAQVTHLPSSDHSLAVILDGRGNSYQQQFRIAEYCDLLIIVLDHNSSDTEGGPEQSRIEAHRDFLDQISQTISKYRTSSLQEAIFLWNKRDLWQMAEQSAQDTIVASLEGFLEEWRRANYQVRITGRAHSNEEPEDVALVMQDILRFSQSWKAA